MSLNNRVVEVQSQCIKKKKKINKKEKKKEKPFTEEMHFKW